jgi:hypothetical protein
MTPQPNKSMMTNRRCPCPLVAKPKLGRVVHAPSSLSAAVAYLRRYPKGRLMKTLLNAVILATSIVAAGVVCQAQVYSINGVSPDSFLPAPHRADEIKLWSCTYGSGPQAQSVEWYFSTNALAKQVRWDGFSAEVPMSARRACALALPRVRERLPGVRSWSVESVLLRKPYLGELDLFPEVWYYQITFIPRASEDRGRKDYQADYYAATQIVLLDGTVVPQTVLKKK